VTASFTESASLRDQADASLSLISSPGPDLFLLDLAEKLEDSLAIDRPTSQGTQALARLREQAAEKALSSHWPTNRDEAYRFTDVRFIKELNVIPAPLPQMDVDPFVDISGFFCTQHSISFLIMLLITNYELLLFVSRVTSLWCAD
jgi:hypothetical protein